METRVFLESGWFAYVWGRLWIVWSAWIRFLGMVPSSPNLQQSDPEKRRYRMTGSATKSTTGGGWNGRAWGCHGKRGASWASGLSEVRSGDTSTRCSWCCAGSRTGLDPGEFRLVWKEDWEGRKEERLSYPRGKAPSPAQPAPCANDDDRARTNSCSVTARTYVGMATLAKGGGGPIGPSILQWGQLPIFPGVTKSHQRTARGGPPCTDTDWRRRMSVGRSVLAMLAHGIHSAGSV
ncbi:uncharacterized protein F5Z01DRAFT_487790 [Emericellopsis atlantica]|uniref:Uncharacterized protein n=1 Tax=Emericellopsis atlantica TaxID=2614577 RepID=A0A9P7ZSC6_9HYPO|nr:uncharacterized protein F5Z01DRAFT_487790 [Emericellopsis atlantica]KAG9256773.1 hypothetical protein F5Z01DRAFT_487790 [Emericellopsis atlantica]